MNINFLYFFVAILQVSGCANYSGAGDALDRISEAREIARQEGVKDFSCSGLITRDSVKAVHEQDWQVGLFSDYLVQVSGCSQTATYRVSCREGGLCEVAE